MARILITSGPTRQYLDPVRYITNASSGKMGAALAAAALRRGHQVVIVSGPVQVEYPPGAEVRSVVTTQEMLETCCQVFASCDGVIGAAAPCDYQPQRVADHKLAKTGQPLELRLIETPDVIATLGQRKRPEQWAVGFALETDDQRFRALVKMEKKLCDLMISNGPQAINAEVNEVEILDRQGNLLLACRGTKDEVADAILQEIQLRLVKLRDQPLV